MDDFASQIYSQVHQIPHGKVATYGDIAKFAGFPGYARQVGRLMATLPEGSKLPWHRVINAKGMISLSGNDLHRQRERLLQEGIEIAESGKLKLARYRWDGR
ncbi:MGMT family protein [Photobacterium chitinilyticum]|uniref:MGMT family protein n=1 Tax=Photobacterium chitinilyticum TaxID=2485123 RepID=A0A3S3UIR3_9GAMM|nr:MGMT family protein [Photobacterium chitinilyticum]RWX53420.1 MGMT family protein [Photobacterium chitinilyticum]